MANEQDTPLTQAHNIVQEQNKKGMQTLRSNLLKNDDPAQKYKSVLLDDTGYHNKSNTDIAIQLFWLDQRGIKGLFRNYKAVFIKEFDREPTYTDYQELYMWCLNVIILLEYEKYFKTSRSSEPVNNRTCRTHYEESFISFIKSFKSELKTLNEVFTEFSGKEKSPSIDIQKIIEQVLNAATKRGTEVIESKNATPEIIQEIIDALQLSQEPIDGKYCITGKSDRQFVFWVVENKYHDRLTADNYNYFIHCKIKEETIKKYFQEAIEESEGKKKKKGKKSQTDKSGMDPV